MEDQIPTADIESREALLVEVNRRLSKLEAVFALSRLDGAGQDAADIASYYEQSRLGYKVVHSAGGAMHMALNPDGKFSRDGYTAQARLVGSYVQPGDRVLELAMGNGYNLNWLGSHHLDARFFGIDLVDLHVAQTLKNTTGLANVHPTRGDFQSLPFPDDAFNVVYAIEGLCHATDMPRALRESHRVTAPGGRLLVIDGWRKPGFDALDPTIRRAAALVEGSMAVGMPSRFDTWCDDAESVGWSVTSYVDHTQSIVPNLNRFADLAERYLEHPRLVRCSQRLLPTRLLTNAVAAYLMPLCVQAGAHTYRAVKLAKAVRR